MKRIISSLLSSALLMASGSTALSCTGIMLKTADDNFVHGRTLEFGLFIETDVVMVPRAYNFTGKTPKGDGKSWKSKYAALGIITFDNLAILDGVNEKGLTVGGFYFPSCAEYTPTTKENQAKSLSAADFSNWLLTSFASVEEVRTAVKHGEVVIAPTLLPGFPPEPQPFHYIVYDKTGACIVIEPVGGGLKIHDNPIGVITNSPTFDWHMTNLRNYIALDPLDVSSAEVKGTSLKQLGQGTGMLGLPGDFTPPSRFVRAAVFSSTAIPEKNAERGIFQVFHILNNFDIPIGVSREKMDGKLYTDYTMLTVARDPQNLKYYWKSYEDQTLRSVDMKKLNFDAKKVIKLPTKGKQPVLDVTTELK